MYILQVYLYNIYQVRFGIQHNVRRYVALAQSRGGACFCTRGAMQGYDVVLFILALAKTVTPAGVPGGSRGSLCRQPHNYPFKSENSRGTEANDIYRPVMCRLYLLNIIIVFFRMAFCYASLSCIQSCIESWQDLHTDTNQSIGSRPMLYFAYFLWWTSVA